MSRVDAYFEVAEAYERVGKHEKAREYFRAVMEIAPGSEQAKVARGFVGEEEVAVAEKPPAPAVRASSPVIIAMSFTPACRRLFNVA